MIRLFFTNGSTFDCTWESIASARLRGLRLSQIHMVPLSEPVSWDEVKYQLRYLIASGYWEGFKLVKYVPNFNAYNAKIKKALNQTKTVKSNGKYLGE